MSNPTPSEKPKAESDTLQAEAPEGPKDSSSSAKSKLVAAGTVKETEAASSAPGSANGPRTDEMACARKLLMGVSTAVLAASIVIPLLAHACCENEVEEREEGNGEGKEDGVSSPYDLVRKLLSLLGFSSYKKSGKENGQNHPSRGEDQSASDYATTQSL